MANKINEDEARKSKTFFMLILPILIALIIPDRINNQIFYPIVLKTLMFFWIYLALKNFVDRAL